MSNSIEPVIATDSVGQGAVLDGQVCCPGLVACLAIGWIVVPAVQYFATMQRTQLLFEGKAAYPQLAELDLAPAYWILLGLSGAYAAWRRLGKRRVSR